MHKAGFVSIIGKPNVGKSTLLNSMLGLNLSIVTHKAQTTRHRIKGIYNDDDHQVVFSDTPGLIDPHYLLQEKMMGFVESALEDSDLVLFVTEPEKEESNSLIIEKLKKITVPLIVVINKADLFEQELILQQINWCKEKLKPIAIVPVSALKKFNTDALLQLIKESLPENPPYFEKEDLSDMNQRFFIAEIIREKIFIHFKKEIPYSTEVSIDSFKEKENVTHIEATIYAERDSQKGILIGRQGEGIKRIGSEARRDIELFISRKVHLELFVKVEKDWRTNKAMLKRFGYIID